MRACTISVVVLGALAAAGCATVVTDRDTLNRAVDYLPWQEKIKVLNKTQWDFAIKPGMQVRIESVTMNQRQRQRQLVQPSLYTWVVPNEPTGEGQGEYDRESFFFLSQMAALGFANDATAPQQDGFKRLNELIRHSVDASDTGAYRRIGKNTLAPAINGLMLRISTTHGGGANAADLAVRLCAVTSTDIPRDSSGGEDIAKPEKPTPQPMRALIAQLPAVPGATSPDQKDLVHLTLPDSRDVLFTATTLADLYGGDPRTLSDWYDPSLGTSRPYVSRTSISVRQAVRFDGETTSHFLSPCTSVGQLERATGQRISGLRRKAAYVCGEASSQTRVCALRTEDDMPLPMEDIVGRDGYVSFGFGRSAPPRNGASRFIRLSGDAADRNELVFAHGDVVFFSGRDPRSATDDPGAMVLTGAEVSEEPESANARR
jgi:hypothetical protein